MSFYGNVSTWGDSNVEHKCWESLLIICSLAISKTGFPINTVIQNAKGTKKARGTASRMHMICFPS